MLDDIVFYTLFNGSDYWRSGDSPTDAVMKATWFSKLIDAENARELTPLVSGNWEIVKHSVVSEQLVLGDA